MKYSGFEIERIFVTYTETDENGYEHFKNGYKCIVFTEGCARDAMPIDVFFIEDNSKGYSDDCWDVLAIIKYIDEHLEYLQRRASIGTAYRRKPIEH